MNKLTKLTLLFVISIWISDAAAQWTHFNMDNTAGIQANSVNDIELAANGDLWFATENGAFKWNSNSNTWSEFTVATSDLPSNSVNDIDASGNFVLLATDNGICYRQTNGDFSSIGVIDGLPSPFITGISRSSSSSFWAVTYGGGIIRQVNSTRNYYSTETGLPTNYFRCAFKSSDGVYWFGSSNHGVVKFYNEQWSQLTMTDGLAGNTILDIAEDDDGSIWFAGTGGLSRLVNGQFNVVQIPLGTNSDIFYCVKYINGQLWAGGENGIDVFEDGEQVQHLDITDGLNENNVTALCRGSQDKVWTGYAQTGTSYRDNGIWYNKSRNTGLSSNWTNVLGKDTEGRMHFGTDKLTYFDGIDWSNYGITIGQSIGFPNQMWTTSDGRLWAASSNKYAVKNGNQWQSYYKLSNGQGNKMVSQSDGTQWYCSFDGIYRQSINGELTLFDKNTYLSGSYPENILADPSGVIWVISKNNLCSYDGLNWTCYAAPSQPKKKYVLHPSSLAFSPNGKPMFIAEKENMGEPLPGHYVLELQPMLNKNMYFDLYKIDEWPNYASRFRLASDSYGGIWVACEAYGSVAPLLQFTASGSLVRHNVDSYLPSYVTSMIDDGQGYIWLSTHSDGVYRAPLLGLGVKENHFPQEEIPSLYVYPNPANGQFTLELTPMQVHDVITVHDLMGKELTRLVLTYVPQTVNTIPIDLSMLPNGTYLLRTTHQNYLPARIIITDNR